MRFLTILVLLLAQGIPVGPNQGGTVTGVLRDASGSPASGIRVAAMAKQDASQDKDSASMVSLTQTDAAGRYRLESIPPGRYYIVAGRVDLPTFYPGVLEMTGAGEILITPGLLVSSLDFAMSNNSAGRAVGNSYSILARAVTTTWTVPLQIRVEGGGKVPVFAQGRFPAVRLTRIRDGSQSDLPLHGTEFVIPMEASADYRVTVENLPEGYVVKSIRDGLTDLTTNTLKLSGSTAVQTLSTTWSSFAGLPVIAAAAPIAPSTTHNIAVTLSRSAPAANTLGASVTGKIPPPVNRAIYLSGSPGTIYADGTFEFFNVPPGRHNVATLDNGSGRKLGASIIVGNRDISGVELRELLILPPNPRVPAPPGSPGNHEAGLVLLPGTVRGQVSDEATQLTVEGGTVTLHGDISLGYALRPDGSFEFSNLLPGTYKVEVATYRGGTVERTVVVDEGVVDLDLRFRSSTVPD